MRTKILSTAILGCLLATGFISFTLAFAAPAPESLCQESLRGSMQGQSGIALDLNGDGLEDLIVGAPYARGKGGAGQLLVYRGSAARLTSRPSNVLEGDGNLGWSLASLGDLDRDGKPYFATGAINGSGDKVSLAGTVTIYKGGDQPRKVAVLSGQNAMDKFGYTLAVGDLNGDGYPDLIVGAPFHSPDPTLYQKGAVYIYFGPGYDPATTVKIPATSAVGGIGFSVAAGNINGDRLSGVEVDDLLIQASGKVAAFYGPINPGASAPAAPDAVFTSADAGFGKSIAVLPDLSGDRIKDIAIAADQASIGGAANSGRLFIIRGGIGQRTVNVDLPGSEVLAKIDGEASSGRFGSFILPLASGLAVSAVHADVNPWPVTGKIFVFNYSNLTSGASVLTARAFPGGAPNMHLGTSMAFLSSNGQLAAGAPMKNALTGAVSLFALH